MQAAQPQQEDLAGATQRTKILVRRASALTKLGQLPEALSDYREALQVRPGDSSIKRDCAKLEAALCNDDDAEDLLRHAGMLFACQGGSHGPQPRRGGLGGIAQPRKHRTMHPACSWHPAQVMLPCFCEVQHRHALNSRHTSLWVPCGTWQGVTRLPSSIAGPGHRCQCVPPGSRQ